MTGCWYQPERPARPPSLPAALGLFVVFAWSGVNASAAPPVTTGPGARQDNRPPSAAIVVTPSSPTVGDTITVVSESIDPEGDELTLQWRYNEQPLETDAPQWQLKQPDVGRHRIRLIVTDSAGGTDEAKAVVRVEGRMIVDPKVLALLVGAAAVVIAALIVVRIRAPKRSSTG